MERNKGEETDNDVGKRGETEMNVEGRQERSGGYIIEKVEAE